MGNPYTCSNILPNFRFFFFLIASFENTFTKWKTTEDRFWRISDFWEQPQECWMKFSEAEWATWVKGLWVNYEVWWSKVRLHFLLVKLKIPKGNPRASSTCAFKNGIILGLCLELLEADRFQLEIIILLNTTWKNNHFIVTP